MPMNNVVGFQNWQAAKVLGEKVCILTVSFPKSEQYGLYQQIRNLDVSVRHTI